METVGFIGLGIMGRPMALNLLKGDSELLVYDINTKAVQTLEESGAKAADLKTIGRTCDVIFTMLPKGEIVKEVLFREEGLDLKEGHSKIVCDMSSVTPVDSRICYEKLQTMDIGFVDAPVSGGEPKAIDGTLAIMAGGRQEDFDQLIPYFQMMGSSMTLVGGPGCGSIAKLANQSIVNLNIAAVGEALVFATKAGADPQKVYEAIRGGLAGSTVLDAKAPMMMERNFKPGGKISINKKDINNVMETAKELKVPMPLTADLFQIMQWMDVHGCLQDDHSALVKYFEALAEVEVKA